MSKITLGRKEFEVDPPAFGNLRKIMAAFNTISKDRENQDLMMEQSAIIFSLLLGKSIADIEAMPIGMAEIAAAIGQVPEICGMVEAKATSGE